jgi:hypothetical protein
LISQGEIIMTRLENFILWGAVFISLLVLTACGGGGGGGNAGGGSIASVEKTGVFSDSPVAGISYKTETLSGVTNAKGQFEYLPGETVTFSIGDITLPPVPAESMVTPLDMANTTATPDQTLVNILRFLQTLDTDGDLTTIDIDSSIGAAASDVALDFTLSISDFETQVADFLKDAVGDPDLVDEDGAIAHFEGVLSGTVLIGAWTVNGGSDVLVFLDKSRYMIGHSNNIHSDTFSGSPVISTTRNSIPFDAVMPVSAEYGTYTWDSSSGAFSVKVLDDSDGVGGLSDAGRELSITVEGDQLTLMDPVHGDTTFNKVPSNGGIVGAWRHNYDSVVIFLDDGTYYVIHANNTEGDTFESTTVVDLNTSNMFYAVLPVSAEFGLYAYDATSGALDATVIDDSDGPGGLSDPSGDLNISLSGNYLDLMDTVAGDTRLSAVGEFCLFDEERVEYSLNPVTNKTYLQVLTPYENCLKNGVQERYNYSASGSIYLWFETPYLDGRITGVKKKYWYNGRVSETWEYVDNVKQGAYVSYFEDGSVAVTGRYKDGIAVGFWHYYGDQYFSCPVVMMPSGDCV